MKKNNTGFARVCVLVLGLLLSVAGQGAAEGLEGVAMPNSGMPILLKGEQLYMQFGYYSWGPDWSRVRRKQSASGQGDTSRFSYSEKIEKTGGSCTVKGFWQQMATNQLRCEIELAADKDSDIHLAIINLKLGASFSGQSAEIINDGQPMTVNLPFGKADLGDAVTRISMSDQDGRLTTLVFDEPVWVSMDGELRIAVAKGRLTMGARYPLVFTVELPEGLTLYAGSESIPDQMENWYVFKGASPIPQNSEWNLAEWLDAPAGEHGRIERRGDQLIYNDKPIKLWGLNNSYQACAPDKALADRRADFYAAMGVNTVRLHKYADGAGWSGILNPNTVTEFDPAGLDRMDYFVAALKERGIYTKLSPVFIIGIGPEDRERVPYADEFRTVKKGWIDPKHGSLYIAEELQDLLIDQAVNLLTHKNPYTGTTYAEEPAIAYFELYNEDSSLFGGVTRVMAESPTLRIRAGKMFADWLKKKYGDEQTWRAAWGDGALNHEMLQNQKIPQDESWAAARIYPAGNPWFFDPDNLNTSQVVIKRRLLDTMLFLYELQNNVYERLVKAVRDTGYEGEIVASNWQAGRMMSHFYNLHSDASIGGTIDRHNYFGGNAGGRPGLFSAASMLARPGSGLFSSSLQQVDGLPFMLSEWIHVYPNEWGVEGPAILGSYAMGLQGWDVSYAFQNSDEGTYGYALGNQAWDVVAPHFLGIFPAVSRQVLRGDVKESDVVHYRHVHIPSLDEGKVGFEGRTVQSFDEKSFDSDVFPMEALAAVRGVVRFTDSFQLTEPFDLSVYRQEGKIVSSTGQLRWRAGENAQDGHIEINTPGTQAIVGFAKGKRIELDNAAIIPQSRFGAIYLSAQSPDKTLADDRAILISAIARARNQGAKVMGPVLLSKSANMRDKYKVNGPILMEPVVAEIQLKGIKAAKVRLLDHNGVATANSIPVVDGVFQIDTGRDQTPYYLIETR